MKTNQASCSQPSPFRGTFRWMGVVLASAVLALLPQLGAQSAGGTVSGSVIDGNTGKYLEGAEVTVVGTGLRASTSRTGEFSLQNVPAGAQQLVVAYVGAEAKTVPVTVAAGQNPEVKVTLGSEVIQLGTFTVAGTKEGMAQAISLQKEAINSKVVAAGDQYGDIAEGNAAEYIKFLPGVGIDYNANDARAATLRGMATQFTNVTMNGNPVASATSGNLNRRFEFEQVAINNVESIEVYKTLTPEMQATSTGGSINLVTKSAFDREGSLLTYRAYLQATGSDLYLRKTEGWGQEKTRKILPGVDINYAARLRENLGFNVAYKNSQLFNNYPRSTYTYQYNPASGGTPDKPAISSWNLQNEQKNTRRQALSGQIDYKLSDSTKLSFNGQWNFYDLIFTDRTTTVTPGVLPALSTTSTVTHGNGTFTGAAPTSATAGGGSVAFQTINRSKTGVTWSTGLNATHDFENGAKLEGSTYWSQAYSKYADTSRGWFSDVTMTRTNLNVRFDNIGAVSPNYTITDFSGAAVDLRDVSKFSVSQIRSRPQDGMDTKSGYSADYKIPLKTGIPITVKVGGRFDLTTRTIDNQVYNRTGTSTATGFGAAGSAQNITGAQLAALVDTGFSNHPIGYGQPAYNFVSVYAAAQTLGGLNYLPYTPASDIHAFFNDKTSAGYARLDLKPLKDLLIVVGARYEDRKIDSENRLPTYNLAALAVPRNLPASFTDKSWFPSINLKYTPTRELLFRFGAAKSLGLPDYTDLLPQAVSVGTTADAQGRYSISLYNSALEAYDVINYDAGVEYYFGRSSFVSASIFRKDLRNYIVDVRQTLDANLAATLGVSAASLGQPIDQYDVSYKFNVPEAGHYNGLELGYSQNFSFLPKPFNTLSLQFNATFLSIDPIKTNRVLNSQTVSDPNLNDALKFQIGKNLELSSVKRAYNLTLNYSIGKLGLTATSSYTGKVLKTVNRATVKYSDVAVNRYFFEYLYQSPRNLVDLRLDYKWNRKYTPYFQARNVFSRAIVTSTQALPSNRAEYGDPIYELGVRGVW